MHITQTVVFSIWKTLNMILKKTRLSHKKKSFGTTFLWLKTELEGKIISAFSSITRKIFF